ncbi:MAG TPA: phosphopentomutase [Ktedonobacterales bacterium]|nr:phosphopentomutase [Ktedonobacterales bacterium]
MSEPVLDRAVVIVLDGVGIGHAPDAAAYGDEGADSLGHAASAVRGLALPHLGALGLGRLAEITGVAPAAHPAGAYGRMIERAVGKDSVSGHWELMGLTLTRAMPTYPHGFPADLVARFEAAIGRGVLGNVAASGVEIIQRLGAESARTGKPILYTSADSVFQLAAHEDVIPVERLYAMCEVARGLLTGEHAVGRVIARPFVGTPGAYVRTARRKDFALTPPAPTLLDRLAGAGYDVLGVGKIEDLFAGRGLTESVHPGDNAGAMAAALERLARPFRGLLFVNLVDMDQLYGHRRDPRGYAASLAAFDAWLPGALTLLGPRDALFITGDHGNDPTWRASDHTREMAPLVVVGPGVRSADLGVRQTFADVGATLAELFAIPPLGNGTSFARELGAV